MTTRAGGCSRPIYCGSCVAGLAMLLCTAVVHGLGLGEMRVQSALGEPLVAEIALQAATKEELSTLDVTLGAHEVFKSAGVSRPQFLNMLEFDVVDSTPPVIRVTTSEPLNEPYLHLIVRARWEYGMMLGEYTALLDPPLYGQQQPESISTPVVIDEADQQPVVSAIPEEAAAPQPAPAEVSGAAMGGFVYGPIASGDKLWGIASLVDTSGLNANIFQVMMALLRENPDAFVGNNINRLKIGATLTLTDRESIVLISKGEAGREYTAQIEQWEGADAEAATAQVDDDHAAPRTEIIEEEVAAAEPTAEALATATEPEGEGVPEQAMAEQTGEAAPDQKDKYVFKIAPPESGAGGTESETMPDSQAETEAMRAAIDREIMTLREQVARLELQQRESDAASATEAEIASIKAQAQSEINELKDQIAFLRQASADQEILALRGEIAAMKQAQTVSADASGAIAALSQAQQEIRDLRAQVAALKQGITDAPSGQPQQDFSDLSSQVELPGQGEPEGPSARVDAIRAAADTQVASMREQMEAMRAEMGKLLEAQQEREQENADLEKRVEELVGMLEAGVESSALANLTTPAPEMAEQPQTMEEDAVESSEAGDGAAPTKARMAADSGDTERAVWAKWLDRLPEDDESRIAIGAGILLILLLLWLMIRRRRSLMRMEESILMTGGTLDGTASQLSEIRTKKPRYLSDLSMAGMGRMEAVEVDPLAEAEVYLAYSRTGQAIQVLKEAAGRHPERKELKLKLLELYQQQGDVKSFDDLVSEMDPGQAGEDQLVWNKVVELKLKMQEGDSALGQTETPAGGGDAVASPPRASGRDWELRLDEPGATPDAAVAADSGKAHDMLLHSAGPVDPALRPFPEPDEDARIGEDVLSTLGRTDESAPSRSDTPAFERSPADPDMLNFNTTNPSELSFELDPEEAEAAKRTGAPPASAAAGPGTDKPAADEDQGGQLNEVSIKAELAEAYLNMGDKEEALRILEEILGTAGPAEKQRITELIRRANS